MKRFWLKPNPQRDRGLEGTAEAAGILLQMGAELVMEEADSSVRRLEGVRYCSPKEAERFAQGVLVFGGDGTLLQRRTAQACRCWALILGIWALLPS